MEEIIKGLSFTVSFLLFLWYIYNNYGFKEEKKKPKPTKQTKPIKPLYINGKLKQPQTTTEEKPINRNWKTTERLQQEEEYYYFNNRLKMLESMLNTVKESEKKAEDKILTYYNLNQYGVVINDKTIKKAENELYTAQQKRLRIENQLQTAKRGRIKALKAMNTVN